MRESEYALSANRWASGTVEPEGFRYIEKFYLAGSIPVWRFRCADAVLEKRVWMQDNANTTFIRYDLIHGSAPAELEVKILVNYRDIHGTTRGAEWKTSVTAVPRGLCVVAREGATPVYLLSDACEPEARQEWYRDYDLPAERERGLDDREDHLLAGVFRAHLSPGGSATFALSTEAAPALAGRAGLAAREALDQRLLENWIAAHPRASLEAPHWIWQFVLAAGAISGAAARRRWAREVVDHRRLPLVRRMGTRCDDRVAGAGSWRPDGSISRDRCCPSFRDSFSRDCCPTRFPRAASRGPTTAWTPCCGTSTRCSSMRCKRRT